MLSFAGDASSMLTAHLGVSFILQVRSHEEVSVVEPSALSSSRLRISHMLSHISDEGESELDSDSTVAWEREYLQGASKLASDNEDDVSGHGSLPPRKTALDHCLQPLTTMYHHRWSQEILK
ncbi:hypothetical protein L1987_86120 [Smallanthus sonchifolius]|uniref:Uncharacterized protein n=1 Tax=Smallanthus sonchifolius TaxID=185202 RepID=A0ACB8XZN4_9ASTR|nr:hypothetical protein L1987_86120 [Smallanthus sonchifolius]